MSAIFSVATKTPQVLQTGRPWLTDCKNIVYGSDIRIFCKDTSLLKEGVCHQGNNRRLFSGCSFITSEMKATLALYSV